jgi:large subunit ribosomal protein L3
MAGRMGNAQVTIRNQKVMLVDAGNHTLAIAGSVPGAKGTLVLVQGAQV